MSFPDTSSSASYYVYFKETDADEVLYVDMRPFLESGETMTQVVVQTPVPATVPALTVTLQSAATDPQAYIYATGGMSGYTYGFAVTGVTSLGRNVSRTCAVQVNTAAAEIEPFTTQNPEAFRDLVGDIQAGSSAVGTGIFAFDNSFNPQGGSVTWELLAEDGTVWAQGNAYSYDIVSDGFSNTVFAKAVVNVPSNVPPTLEGQKYQIRWILSISVPTPLGSSAVPQEFYSFEQITVVGLNSVPVGTQPSVELQGGMADLILVTDQLYDTVSLSLEYNNTLVAPPLQVAYPGQPTSEGPLRVATGWMYQVKVSTADMTVQQLEPFTAIWRYNQQKFPQDVYSESTDFWVINSSISSAIMDLKATINKARTTLYGRPDLLYPANNVLTFLRRGRDMFNGFKGYFTSFTMVNAKGPIREYWLLCSAMLALEAQIGGEIEKKFDFQGQAIQLNVDRIADLETWIGRMQKRIDDELPNFKTQLINKGNTGGDGSQDPTQLQAGAMGGVGLTMTIKSMANWPSPGIAGLASPPFALRR